MMNIEGDKKHSFCMHYSRELFFAQTDSRIYLLNYTYSGSIYTFGSFVLYFCSCSSLYSTWLLFLSYVEFTF